VPTLKVISGSARTTGRRHVIDRDQIYIGRDPGNDIVVEDVGVTGHHARILKTTHGYLLFEERTSTGIWVQEQRVNHLFLEHGARFRLGGTSFMFDAEQSDTLLGVSPAPVLPPAPSTATAPRVAWPSAPPAPSPRAEPLSVDPVPRAPAGRCGVKQRDPDVPAWAQSGAVLEQLSLPPRPLSDKDSGLEGHTCPGCEEPLVGMERFCAICGARTRYGGRGRVMLLKIVALLLVLGAGSVGLYTLTGGDLSQDGLRRAVHLVLGDKAPSWLRL